MNNWAKTSSTRINKSLIYEGLLWKFQQVKKKKIPNQSEKAYEQTTEEKIHIPP